MKNEKEELLERCIEKKLQGASHLELLEFFDKNNLNKETRNYIESKMNELDENDEKMFMKKRGISNLIIGTAIIIFAFIIFNSSLKEGHVTILNILVWIIGSMYIFKGLTNLFSKKNYKHYDKRRTA